MGIRPEKVLPSILFLGDRALGEQLAAALPEARVRTADSRLQAELALADPLPDLVVADTTQPWVQDLPSRSLTEQPDRRSPARIDWVPEAHTPQGDLPSAAWLTALVDEISRELAARKQTPTPPADGDYWGLLQGLPSGLYRSTPDGRILDANPALVHMLGFPDRETLLQANAMDLHLQGEDRDRVEAELGAHGIVRPAEVCLRRRDGSVLWVEEFARTVTGPDGLVRYHEGALIDITERKRAERASRRREAILHAVAFAGEQFLQNTPWTACIDDVLARVGHAADVSRAYLFAFHSDQAGRPVASQRYEWVAEGIEPQIAHPGLQNLPRSEGAFARWASILEDRQVVVGRMQDFTPAEQQMLAGEEIRSLLLAPIFVEGACWGFVGLDECTEERLWSEGEIDALKAAASGLGAAIMRQLVDDALRRLQEFNEGLLLSMAEGIVVDDADGKIIFANPAALRTLGYPLEKLVGIHWSNYTPADQHDKVRQANSRRARGESDSYEIDVIREGGVRFPVLVSGSPRYERGVFAGTMAVFTDIAERKQAEVALAQRARELTALHEISLDISMQREVSDLLQLIVARATSLVGVPLGGLYLVHPDGQSLQLVVSQGLDGLLGTVLRRGEGLSGRVVETGEPMMVADYGAWEGRAPVYAELQVGRVLAVPMKHAGRVVGVINVTDDVSRELFTEDQVRLVNMFADQAAIAVASARLLEGEQKRSAELARSKGLMAALSQVAAQIERTYDPEQVLQTLAREVRNVGLNYWLGFTDSESDGIVVRYSSLESQLLRRLQKLVGTSSSSLFLQRRRAAFFEEVVLNRHPVMMDAREQMRSMAPRLPKAVQAKVLQLCGISFDTKVVCLPLVVGDQTLGVLSLWGEGIGEEDLTPYSVFASQVASAVEKASLLDETRRRASYLEAITRVASALRTAGGRQEMEAIVIDQLLQMMQADGVCVAMLDPGHEMIAFEAACGRWAGLAGKRQLAGQGTAGKVIESGASIVREEGQPVLEEDLPALRKARSLAGVPLTVEARPMGCLMVGRERPIQPEDLRLLTAVAEMAANAIHRAGLVESLEARVTERTRELKAANVRLRELDSLKSEFVTNVSHELRTPITNILLYLDLVDQPLEDQRRSEYVSILKKESERLGRLIEDLLTLSRIERGVLPLDFQPHALDPLIAEVMAAHEARAQARGVALKHELNPALPVALVSREQILQVFTNLIGNAVAYTPPGEEVAVCSEIWLEDGRA
ncbi:MAG: GAF domain-containing protein, partial [Anaerolineales bacterium]|nr:GAF domain-containing protein [Anaerolineales bacterium]